MCSFSEYLNQIYESKLIFFGIHVIICTQWNLNCGCIRHAIDRGVHNINPFSNSMLIIKYFLPWSCLHMFVQVIHATASACNWLTSVLLNHLKQDADATWSKFQLLQVHSKESCSCFRYIPKQVAAASGAFRSKFLQLQLHSEASCSCFICIPPQMQTELEASCSSSDAT